MRFPNVLEAGRRVIMARLVGVGVLQGCATVATAGLVQKAFDELILNQSQAGLSAILLVTAGLLTAGGLRAVLRWIERVDAERLGQDYVHTLRTRLFFHLTRVSPTRLQKRSRGSMVLRFVGDLTALRQWVSLGLSRLLVAATMIVITLSAILWINFELAVVVTLVLCLGALASYRIGLSMENAVRSGRRARSRLTANVTEKLGSLALMQAFSSGPRERKRVKRQSQQLAECMIERAQVAGKLRAITEVTLAAATTGALLVGILQAGNGSLSVGSVAACMTIVGLLVSPLRDLARLHEYWHAARVSRERIQHTVKTLPRMSCGRNSLVFCGENKMLELKDVSLRGRLQNVTATVAHGSRIAIIGPNGSGKSTLLWVIGQLLRPHSGSVEFNGQNLSAVDPRLAHGLFGVVSHDIPLLRRSVIDNIRYRNPRASKKQLARVIEYTDLEHILKDLPAGLNTAVTEQGTNLSLGQRLRISLSRALLGDPEFLLLDEIDANLDAEARATIDRVVREFPGTVFKVSHHETGISDVDQIWLMKAGRLLETGSPGTLTAGESAFRQCSSRQCSGQNLKLIGKN